MGQSLKKRRNSSKKNKNNNAPTAEAPTATPAENTPAPTETATTTAPATTETVAPTTTETAPKTTEEAPKSTEATEAPKQEEAPKTSEPTEEAPKQQEEKPAVVEEAPKQQQQEEEEKPVEQKPVEEAPKQEEAPAAATTTTTTEEPTVVVATEEQAGQQEEAPKQTEEATTTTTTTTTEEPKQEETVEATAIVEEAPKQEEIVSFNGSHTMTVSNHLHKYIIGPKGSTIKSIQSSCGDEKIKIDLSGDQVSLTSANDDAIRSAIQQIEEILAPHKDKLNVDAMTEQKEYKVPVLLHKYILGDKGSQLKTIQTETQSNLTLNGDANTITIKSMTSEGVEKAFKMVLETLEKVWWYYDEKTETFTENTLTDRLFKQYRTKVNEQHELMSECYEKAKVAFDEGRKDEAKELSEQGKKHKELKEQYSKEAAEAIFAEMNKDKGEDTIDLHGLLVAEALEFVEQRIQKLTESKSIQVLNVITGAGNHSEAEAKIKPMIAKMLDDKSLKYEKGNEGTFIVTLF